MAKKRVSNVTAPTAVIPDPPAVEMDPREEEEEEEEEESEGEGEFSSASSSSHTDSLTWISWFCSLPGHEYFAEVAEDFIEDDFNLTGLNASVPFYKEALDMVLDVEPEEEQLKIPDVSIVESSAELLYGLIHQRFIITRQGFQQMAEKYENAHFGQCARVHCYSTKVLPCGRTDLPGVDTVKLFCPSCMDIYTPPSSRFNGVDGAFFGTTFPHLFFQSHKDLLPPHPVGELKEQRPSRPFTSTSSAQPPPAAASRASSLGAADTPLIEAIPAGKRSADVFPATTPMTSSAKLYIPRIYGFKVSEKARSGPRMQWLRMRERSLKELATVDSRGRWIGGEVDSSSEDSEEEDEEE